MTISRQDISYNVQILSQFMTAPTTEHLKAVHYVLRYLKSCPGKGIFLSATSSTHVIAFCDFDWASRPIGRRSLTSYALQLGQSLMSWRAKKQDIISRSSAEAGYKAMAMTYEITWLLASSSAGSWIEETRLSTYYPAL